MYQELFKVPWVGIGIKSYGFMLMLGFLSAIWFAMRRAERVKANPDLVLNMGFIALIAGVLGARAFYVAHYWKSEFAFRANRLLAVLDFRAGGLEFYGGLLCAVAAISLYLLIRRESWRMYMDILAPAAMWGLAFGRVGCFLNGCCWGGLCLDESHKAALPWAVTFPYGSPAFIDQWAKRQVSAPAELICDSPKLSADAYLLPRDQLAMSPEERDGPSQAAQSLRDELEKARAERADSKEVRAMERRASAMKASLAEHEAKLAPLRYAQGYPSRIDPSRKTTVSELQDLAAQCRSLPVHPTQVYGIINALLLTWLLTMLFYRRRRHGIVMAMMMILYPISRILLEAVRVDNPHDTGGLTISQAVSVGMLVVGIVLLILLYRLPIRSPRAVPFVPPPRPAGKERGQKTEA